MFVKNIYLAQLSEQVNVVTTMISKQLDQKYVNLLQLGKPTNITKSYFEKIFMRNLEPSLHSEIFIFDNDFKVVVNSDSTSKTGVIDSRLLLNQEEIEHLGLHKGVASVPFKGNDNKWYLWGFYRIDNNYWLAVRESAARLEKVDDLSNLFWYIGLAGILITIITGWFMARSITKPIDKLVKFSSEIGKGHFESKIPGKMKGEIKSLADSMEMMKNNLAKHRKEKEQMLAQIAHEIRNPLGGIELLANLTKEDLINDQKNYTYLDRILKEINRLKTLITSYLNYSRPALPKPILISIRKVTEELQSAYTAELNKKKINVQTEIDDIKINFDENHLKQILMNLFANSIESVDENGEIKISVHRKNDRYIITISDDGKGISDENLKSIFNPFFTTKKNGTGLGLAISKKLCNENKAELIVENLHGEGCSFKIIKEINDEV